MGFTHRVLKPDKYTYLVFRVEGETASTRNGAMPTTIGEFPPLTKIIGELTENSHNEFFLVNGIVPLRIFEYTSRRELTAQEVCSSIVNGTMPMTMVSFASHHQPSVSSRRTHLSGYVNGTTPLTSGKYTSLTVNSR
jgi:hypothetical protein